MRTALLLALSIACAPTVAETGVDTDDPVDTDVDTDTDSDTLGPPPDLSEAGPREVLQTDGESSTSNGCSFGWDQHAPDGEGAEVVVVLAHGFARSREQMAGWAEHLASWGVEVYTPDLCTNGFGTDHARNGEALADLVREVRQDRPAVVAGHSAGGLAAFLAGAELGDSVAGVLLLDPVDAEQLGQGAASRVTPPVGAMFAPGSACNGDGNGVAMIEGAPDVRAARLTGSDHCVFEDPTGRLCTFVCEEATDPDAVRVTVRVLMTSFVHWQTGLDPRQSASWEQGADLPTSVSWLR